jgi:predicted ATPase
VSGDERGWAQTWLIVVRNRRLPEAISQSGWVVLEAFSVSHEASAFLPVIDLLWNYFKITSDDERTHREKVGGKVLMLDRSLEDVLPYLYALLGISDENSPLAEMEPQTRKRRSLEVIKRILLRESLNKPLIVIFEDLHWIDDETQAFLNLLADSIGTAKDPATCELPFRVFASMG